MNTKKGLKIATIILFIVLIAYIILFGRYLISETFSIKKSGSTFYLTQSLHHYKLSKMSNDIIPKEISTETIKGPDYINNLKANAINISLYYRIFLLVQIVIIIVLIIKLKNVN
ncbi:MAG: hypothetical protein HFJ42_01035 [Clostridia bacterium]|nr:hypothetical protein [Clostridia bacterium]